MTVRQCTALAGHSDGAGSRRRGPSPRRPRFHGPVTTGPASPARSPAVSSLRPSC